MHTVVFNVVLCLCFVLIPHLVKAEVYSYTDKQGVIHITNMHQDLRSRPLLLKGKKNTFSWKALDGQLKKIHRVDVQDYDTIIQEAARYYTLPPALIKAVIAVESSFEPAAVSHAGALGLMQLIPSTAKQVHVVNVFNPVDNIYGGTRYLRILTNQFHGDLRLTIAAYNAGPKAVAHKQDVPNYPETRKYVSRVLTLYQHYLSTWKTEKH